MGPQEDTVIEESERESPEQISEKEEENELDETIKSRASQESVKSPVRKDSVMSKVSVVDPELSKSAAGSGSQSKSRTPSVDLYKGTLFQPLGRRRYSLDLGLKMVRGLPSDTDKRLRASSVDLNKNVDLSLDDLKNKDDEQSDEVNKSRSASSHEEKRMYASRESILRSLSKQSMNQEEILFEGPGESEILEVVSEREKKSTVTGEEESVLAVEGQGIPSPPSPTSDEQPPSVEQSPSSPESPKQSEHAEDTTGRLSGIKDLTSSL